MNVFFYIFSDMHIIRWFLRQKGLSFAFILYYYHLNMNMQNGKPLELLNFYEAMFKVGWSW